MITAMRKRLSRQRGDEGFSLPELLVVMAVFGLLMAITVSILILFITQTRDSLARAQSLQEMRLGVSQIDRQVRSGNLILDPMLETDATSGVPPYYSMRILTQENGAAKCVQWRVIDADGDGFGDLEFRRWDTGYPAGLVEEWAPVAHNIVDVGVDPSETPIDPDDPSTWPPFWVDPTLGSYTEAQFVRITLRLKEPLQSEDTKPASVTTVVTGRNTVFGYPSSSCQIVPDP